MIVNKKYGFRNKMCTTHALINLVEEISSSLDAKKFSVCVFIDLKKSFDTVNHALLIDKLEFYGLRGPAKMWLKIYLHDRKQLVQIDDCKSTLHNVNCRVTQGSILGPKLFIRIQMTYATFQKLSNLYYLRTTQMYFILIMI